VQGDEDLAENLVFEEADVSQLVEHGGLAHPLGQSHEFCEVFIFLVLGFLVDHDAVHIYDKLVPSRLIFLLKPVVGHHQIIGAIFEEMRLNVVIVHLFARHKLDGVVETVAGKEGNGLHACANLCHLALDAALLLHELIAVLEE